MPGSKTTDTWIADLEPELRPVAIALRRLILDTWPDLTETIKWGNPVYEHGGKVCYLAATKAYVSLGFFNGAALTDAEGIAEGIIEGTGKRMRHVKVRDLSAIVNQRLSAWVKEAEELNLKT